MAHIIELKVHGDERGHLVVAEVNREIPFTVNRIFYIFGVGDPKLVRGGHRHHNNIQALICVSGECEVYSYDGLVKEIFHLDTPNKCLILEPKDWHTMYNFSENAVLLVLASEHYDRNDYIDEEYA